MTAKPDETTAVQPDTQPVEQGEQPQEVAAPRVTGNSRPSEQTVTRIIAVAALVLACGSLVYIANIERQGGLLMTSARAMMSKAGIVENGNSRSVPDKATLLSSIQYLSSAARGSEPFSTELAVAYKMVGEHPEIGLVLDSMLTGAEAGVPSVEDVSASYAATLSKVYGYGPGQLLGQAASSISSIVGITTTTRRRQAIIEEVTVSVAAGKLSQAVVALEKLDEQSSAPFAAWRIEAQKRVALDAAVAEIKRIAFLSILDGAS